MSSSWQPQPRDGLSDLVYRSQFSSTASGLRRQAADRFSAWTAQKGLVVSATDLLHGAVVEVLGDDRIRRLARGNVGSYTDRSDGRRLSAAAFLLEEHQPDGTRWTTSLRVAEPYVIEQAELFADDTAETEGLFELDTHLGPWPDKPWVWLDLEHHRGADGTPVRPGSPRLVRDLLAAVEGTDGSLPLTSDVLDVTEGHVEELCQWLFDEERRVPVIVFSPDPQSPETQQRFAARLARDVAGVAVVVRLVDSSAAAALCRRVGPHLQVYGGAMRTYLPGLQPLEPFPQRHRVLSAASMRALGARSANAVRDQVLALSTRRTPPASYPLIRRILVHGVAERTLGHRRRRSTGGSAAPQPGLFPLASEPAVLPGIDDLLATAPEVEARPDTAEANQLLRSTLTLAGIDPATVPIAGDDTPAAYETERRFLQDLFVRSLREAGVGPVNADVRTLSTQLREANDEISFLYAEIEVFEAQLRQEEKTRSEVEALRDERDFADLELAEAERTAERLRARLRWLESELAKLDVHVVGSDTPEDPLAEAPGNVVEVLELAAARLPHLAIGATADAAAGLDVHPRSERWAIKTWQALVALNAYAEARSNGMFANSFLAWCQEPPSGALAIPATWVAMGESETTNSMPKLREARTFPVPVGIDHSGHVYMPAHIKIQQGGSPCPRIHFHDDAGGTTARIHIGYVGDHLPTANFK